MPNTKSAAKQLRKSKKRQIRNRAVKQRLRKLIKGYLQLVQQGDRAAATKALAEVASALDKAAKSGVIHWATANRKKSRLANRLNKLVESTTKTPTT